MPALSLQPPSPHPDPDPRYSKLSDEEKQDWSWQYYGYPGFSQWMGSSNDFFLLRKFSALNARALLFLQNEISQKERMIEQWDDFTMKFPPGQGGCGSFQKDEANHLTKARSQLLRESIPLLRDYYNLVNAYAPIKTRPTASNDQRNNMVNWFINHPNAIDDEEKHFLDPKRRGDLFPIVSKQKPPLAMWLEQIRLFRLPFRLSQRADRVEAEETRYHSATGVEVASSVVIVVVGLGLLFGPMWWLNYVSDDRYRLGIITGFVSLFATWLWMAAGPRAFEILAGTAAYAAVLMVFLQVQKEV
ncbi:hypothetical protein PRZ48_015192 [Zasmidium cellare]|uniref:DUF6594 domain-containing protein n=1 Tax=Zasmidium cellare TaxID=395010 RepID=A0ABR0DYJ1_ZASCE|nr:hypothetical protein PRZ48_015192 [Zasmidium cellare]